MKVIKNGVVAPIGFKANGIHAGIRENKSKIPDWLKSKDLLAKKVEELKNKSEREIGGNSLVYAYELKNGGSYSNYKKPSSAQQAKFYLELVKAAENDKEFKESIKGLL